MSVRDYERWRRVLDGHRLPAAAVDLDAVDSNLALFRKAVADHEVTIRVATKSLRHPWLIRYVLEAAGADFRGLMTFSPHEALFLAEQGFDDFLMGYPVGRRVDADALAALAERGSRAIATVDGSEQLSVLSAAATASGTTIPVCIDVDVSWRPLRGKFHFGVRRSPVRSADDALQLARLVRDTPGLRLTSLLAYEAQVAGIREVNPTSRHLDPVRRLIKSRSLPVILDLRAQVAEALRSDGFEIGLVNGGGTGSVHWTRDDPHVTEVTVGSGFLCSHLFDGYHDVPLRPAAFFAIPVVRQSDGDYVTCAGGGYLASGPGAPDRAPAVHLPHGLTPLGMEGFGEVQTPFKLSKDAPDLGLGDPVLCRHAKAGELAERFNSYLFVRGDEVVGVEPTYRGMGQCFM